MSPIPDYTIATAGCGSFSSFPVEVLTSLYCQFSSLWEVLIFSYTCHHIRDVWLHNVVTIYKHVGRASIPCERHARNFLAVQGGPAPDAQMTSAKDVVQMMRNMHTVEKTIVSFEREIVCNVKCHSHRPEDYYGAGARRHPPHLTQTERRRFIRSYYQVWSLMLVDNNNEWTSRLQRTSLKQLLYLNEISWLPYIVAVGDDFMQLSQGSIATSSRQSTDEAPSFQNRLQALCKTIGEQTEQTYRRLHGESRGPLWVYAIDEGYMNFLVMWDHWQSSLKELVCGTRSKAPPYQKDFHWEFWEDSSDDEL